MPAWHENMTLEDHKKNHEEWLASEDAATALECKEAVRALTALSVAVGNGSQYGAKLDPAGGAISLDAHREAAFSMPMQGAGETPIGFNVNYLLRQAQITPEFSVQWAGSGDPAIIRAGGEVEAPDAHALWVLMPMRV